MTKASIRDLRYQFDRIERLLQQGQVVEITRHRKVIARLTPETPRKSAIPDFLDRMQRVYGEKVMETTGTEIVALDRGRY